MRVMSVDYGDKRIGLALSDPMRIIATPLEVYQRRSLDEDMQFFAGIAKQHSVSTFVVGLPYNMDGSSGERVDMAKEFGQMLADATGIKVEYQDERWTSLESERRLIEADVRRDKRKKVIDKMAAQIILQSYLDSPRNIK